MSEYERMSKDERDEINNLLPKNIRVVVRGTCGHYIDLISELDNCVIDHIHFAPSWEEVFNTLTVYHRGVEYAAKIEQHIG